MKSHFQKLLCPVFSPEQSEGMLEPSVAPASDETWLSRPAQNWAASGGLNSDATHPQLAKGRWHQYCWLEGTYLAAGKWHYHRRRELHLTETLPSSFLTCPMDKPSIPGT